MLFQSTRGLAPETDVRGVALEGLAPDGGLYVPKEWPQFVPAEIEAMRGKSYQEIAFLVLQPFMRDVVPDVALRDMIAKSYGVFDRADIVSLRELDHDFHILELFHGPTLAFKDIAMQFIGYLFEYFLRDSPRRMTVIGATSGDTGSAAITALADRANIDLFILYPNKGPSDIQRKQMTCVDALNVHALAIEGSFDDCQSIVKDIFADPSLREELNLTTVNSINLVRILAQIVYYFVAVSRLGEAQPCFVVPTGNFGDIFAGYAAMKCGLPISRLVVASNSNDILTRFFKTGTMQPEPVTNTLSPSMDIQVSSNFERLLFDLCNKNAMQVRDYMEDLKKTGHFTVAHEQIVAARKVFAAGSAEDRETLAIMTTIDLKFAYLIDPHTAVGVKVAHDLLHELPRPIVCLATANAGKFPQAVVKATSKHPELPEKTLSLINRPERTTLLPTHKEQITAFIREHKG